MSVATLTIVTLLLFGALFVLTAFISACRRLHPKDAEQQLELLGNRFFYRSLHVALFPNHNLEGILFVARCVVAALQVGLGLTILLWGWELHLLPPLPVEGRVWELLLTVLLVAIPLLLFGDFLPRLLGSRYPRLLLKIAGPLSAPLLLLGAPLCLLFLKLLQILLSPTHFEHFGSSAQALSPEILQLVHEASVSPGIEDHDKKIFEAAADFRKRLAREVMVPRVDVFTLPAETSIRVAAQRLEKEGYSRTPVYRQGIDNVVGVLMSKDIQQKYREAVEKGDLTSLDAPIDTIIKPALYTPETKRISNLLQEFRAKQMHMAIVVDEYGGTEGIVTIEDILEQLVGDISDEYDDREVLAVPHPHGGWIIDPRMTILDVEEKFGIEIPQEDEYDTVAGYIFHCAGAIPAKGFVIHRDTFEIEILSSNDRSVKRVRLKKG